MRRVELLVAIEPDADADAEDAERLGRQLRNELRSLDVDDVAPVASGEPPAGSKDTGHRPAWALPVASGLVLGVALVLAERATYWASFFVAFGDSYEAGPGLWFLLVGAAVVVAAGVVVLTRSPVAGRPAPRTDWRLVCALVVAACLVWAIASGPETDSVPEWTAAYAAPLLLAGVALPITLLWLTAEQRIAALVAVTLFGAWLLSLVARELVDPQLGLETSVYGMWIAGIVLVLLACVTAQTGAARAPAAASRVRR